MKSVIHDCVLERWPNGGPAWRCDADKMREGNKGCESGITDFY